MITGSRSLAPHLIEGLQKSVKEILETMVTMTAEAIDEVVEDRSTFDDEVTALLGFTGTRSGTFVVRSDSAMAIRIAAKMLMLEPEQITDFADAADAFGEVVNMLAGNFKNSWVAEGNQMDLAVPKVIRNGKVTLVSDKKGCMRSGIRVKLDGGILHIGVHFEG